MSQENDTNWLSKSIWYLRSLYIWYFFIYYLKYLGFTSKTIDCFGSSFKNQNIFLRREKTLSETGILNCGIVEFWIEFLLNCFIICRTVNSHAFYKSYRESRTKLKISRVFHKKLTMSLKIVTFMNKHFKLYIQEYNCFKTAIRNGHF